MADEKISVITEKTTLNDADLNVIVDSVTGLNARIKVENQSHDYKTWYVDDNNGLDSNKGTFKTPFKTLQAAYDERITNAFAGTGLIILKTAATYASLTATQTSLDTEIRAEVFETTISTVTLTNVSTITFTNIWNIPAFNFNQTGTTRLDVILIDTNIGGIAGTVNDETDVILNLRQSGSSASFVSSSPDMHVIGSKGAHIKLGNSTSLHEIETRQTTIDAQSTGISLGDVTMIGGQFLTDSSPTTINNFDHDGVSFTNYSSITVTTTETKVLGEWAT